VAQTAKWTWLDRKELVHAVRTAVAATASLLIGHFLRLPESYWSVIATLIVMQSTLGAAWTISKERMLGTVLGAAAGALLATIVGQSAPFALTVAVFGAGVLVLGVLCALLHIERSSYRYAGITLVIVMLIARTQPAWIIAIHRAIEMSIGIAIGLVVTALWPEARTQEA
jgi:uncharacterized membrane protein YccC